MRKAIPQVVRKAVKEKFQGRCAYCGQKPEKIHIDHIKPVIRGGDNSIENLLPACFSCNNYKMSFDLEGFRAELTQQVHRARAHSLNFRLAERFGMIAVKEIARIEFYFEQAHVAS